MPIGKTDASQTMLTPAGDPIMTAKFLVPVSDAPVLDRPRLFDRLTAAAAGPLTLVSAPAGSGKTVLASSWVRAGAAPGPVGWISAGRGGRPPGCLLDLPADRARSGARRSERGRHARRAGHDRPRAARAPGGASRGAAHADRPRAGQRRDDQQPSDLRGPRLPGATHRRATAARAAHARRPRPACCPSTGSRACSARSGSATSPSGRDEAAELLAARRPELSDSAVLAFSLPDGGVGSRSAARRASRRTNRTAGTRTPP